MSAAAAPRLERLAALAPWLILGYFALQFAIRLAVSPNLETDEAQFVGRTYFALGYANSHPPLYNWLVAGALWLTGGGSSAHWIAALALVKNALLAGTYLLAFDLMRRITGRQLAGLLAALSFLFLPQIIWKSQITLAHSVMVMFAIVAALHAIVLIVQGGRVWSFVWLGAAAGIGAMAKYNLFLALAAIMAASLSVPEIRQKLFRPKLFISAAVTAACFAPHFLWALLNLDEATGRIAKLERENKIFGALDLPYIGVDGMLATFVAALAWAGPLLLIWFAIWRFSPPLAEAPPDGSRETPFKTLFLRATAIGFLLFLVAIAAADLHYVHERYLTPVLMPLPFWLALAFPLEARGRGALRFAIAGGVAAALMFTAAPAAQYLGDPKLDYAGLGARVRASVVGPAAIHASEEKYAANFAFHVPEASIWRKDFNDRKVLIVWAGKSEAAPGKLVREIGDNYKPGPIFKTDDPRLKAQLYTRAP